MQKKHDFYRKDLCTLTSKRRCEVWLENDWDKVLCVLVSLNNINKRGSKTSGEESTVSLFGLLCLGCLMHLFFETFFYFFFFWNWLPVELNKCYFFNFCKIAVDNDFFLRLNLISLRENSLNFKSHYMWII